MPNQNLAVISSDSTAISPTLLALDFDGVLCDGLIEYFQSSWRTYQQLWRDASSEVPESVALSFYQLRPVIETGWEMPILIRALLNGIDEKEILTNWHLIRQQLIVQENLNSKVIELTLDQQRDRWITEDLPSWLSCHRFYPGVCAKLRQILNGSIQVFIITTKEERFVRQLLAEQQVQLPEGHIFGKGVKRPKYQILQSFNPSEIIWFVEDRLPTLESVQKQPNLQTVKLFLADWGYNTLTEREIAAQNPHIHLLSLAQFAQSFETWITKA